MLEMLTLVVLMLMMHRSIAFAFHLRLPSQLLPSFALRVVTLVVRKTMMGRDVGRSAVSIAHRKDDG